MIAGLAITLIGLTLGAPQEHPASEADHTPAAVEQAADSAHAPAVQEAEGGHGAEPGAADQHAEEWGTETMIHHIVDSESLEIGPATISLAPLKIPPVHVGRFEIDLSPTKHVIFLMLASLLTILTVGLAARRANRTDSGREAPRRSG